jgi:outer membrane biogenesis lipoprotein LolB
MIFMKIYALTAVASACFLITSCTTDDLENQNVDTSNLVIQNEYNARTGDSISLQTDPVKTNGKD